MYQIVDDRVLYGGKEVAANPLSFEELAYELARDDKNVFYHGRAQAGIDPTSFRVLDEFFTRDRNTVFLLRSKKLKPLKADPTSFIALGFGYARDQKQGYYLDRTTKTAALETLTPIGDGLALDARGVFWTNRRVLGESVSQLGLRCRVQPSSVYFWNCDGVWFSEHFWPATQLPDVDPESFCVLAEDYSRDKERLFYGSQLVTQLSGREPAFREDSGLMDLGDALVFRGAVLAECDPVSTVIVDHHPLDRRGVYFPDGTLAAEFADPRGTCPETRLRQVLGTQMGLLDLTPVLGDHPSLEEVRHVELPGLEFEIQGPRISVRFEGEELSATWDTLDGLAGLLWTRFHYGQAFHRYLHTVGVSYPRGDFQSRACLELGGADFLDAVKGAACQTLPGLASMVVASLGVPKSVSLLESLSYEALRPCAILRESPCATTNQARAKQIIERVEPCSDNPYIRLLAAQELYGLVASSSKTEGFLQHTGQAVAAALRQEPEEALRRRWLGVLDLLMAQVWLRIDSGEAALYREAAPYLEILCRERFNLDLNLARLWEAKHFLEEDAGEVESRLRELVGKHRMAALWSGLNLDSPGLDAWFASARLRLLRYTPRPDQEAGAKEFLRTLEHEIVGWGEPWAVANILCDLESLMGDLESLGRSLTWPSEELYTRLSQVEYLVDSMPYELEEVVTEDQGFVVRGWPWGRRVEVEVAGKRAQAFLGIRCEWPGGKPVDVTPPSGV